MYEKFFAERLSALRLKKNVSAREMSLAIGQNASYINRIENRRAFPSMQCFFYMCEYLGVTPQEFFDAEIDALPENKKLSTEITHLTETQQKALLYLIESFQLDEDDTSAHG